MFDEIQVYNAYYFHLPYYILYIYIYNIYKLLYYYKILTLLTYISFLGLNNKNVIIQL